MNTAIDDWFVCLKPRPDAAAQLFCLPYAGAGASVFRRWPAAVGADVEIQAVKLPGRESRITEEPEFDIADITAAIAARADRPYGIYGHSMGGRIGFEVARSLCRSGATPPVRLYLGACRAVHLPAPGLFDGLSRLSDGELVERLAAGGGVPAAVLAEPELVEFLLPVLRADFRWLDDYVFAPGPPLPVPVMAFAGTTDTAAAAEHVGAWARHTTDFRLHEIDGGHFFLHDRLEQLADMVTADLRAAVPGPAGHTGGAR